MSTSREYEVVLTPEAEGGFSVAVPALPGCTSQGETREEALSMIREAIEAYIESLVAHGDPIPGPVEIERVTVTAWPHAVPIPEFGVRRSGTSPDLCAHQVLVPHSASRLFRSRPASPCAPVPRRRSQAS